MVSSLCIESHVVQEGHRHLKTTTTTRAQHPKPNHGHTICNTMANTVATSTWVLSSKMPHLFFPCIPECSSVSREGNRLFECLRACVLELTRNDVFFNLQKHEVGGHSELRTECTNNTSPYAHVRTLRTPDVITRLAQGLDDLFVCLKSHSIIGHVLVGCSFDPVSSFLIYCFTDATDWNQIKLLCYSAPWWTVWPSGRSDPKHRL